MWKDLRNVAIGIATLLLIWRINRYLPGFGLGMVAAFFLYIIVKGLRNEEEPPSAPEPREDISRLKDSQGWWGE